MIYYLENNLYKEKCRATDCFVQKFYTLYASTDNAFITPPADRLQALVVEEVHYVARGEGGGKKLW